MTLFTLTMGGAIFIAVFNVRVTLHDYINSIGNYFLADVSLDFNQPYRLNEVENTALQVPGVVAVEGWAYTSAEAINPDGTVGDTLTILAPPVNSKLVAPIMVSGRWLQPGDQKAITVSEDILAKFPGLAPGKTIRLKINGHEDDWTVVGIFKFASQDGTMAYGTYEYISKVTQTTDHAFTYRIVTDQHNPAYQQVMSDRLDKYFRDQGFPRKCGAHRRFHPENGLGEPGYPGDLPADHGTSDGGGRQHGADGHDGHERAGTHA